MKMRIHLLSDVVRGRAPSSRKPSSSLQEFLRCGIEQKREIQKEREQNRHEEVMFRLRLQQAKDEQEAIFKAEQLKAAAPVQVAQA
jgi:hypothetical protein